MIPLGVDTIAMPRPLSTFGISFPSLNTFYQMVTMFDISVDQYFYPSKNRGSECRKRIDAMLNALDEKELKIVEATIQAMKAAKETEDA